MNKTGEKVRYFRERLKEAQLDIELAINAAPGTLSRIENGQTNPTKETLLKIVKYLKLNKYETSYLLGETDEPVNQLEIENAQKKLQDYLDKKGVLAYVKDDRARLITLSKDFKRLMNVSEDKMHNMIGVSLVKVVLDDSLGIKRSLDEDGYADLLEGMIYRYYFEVGFMVTDYFNIATKELIFNSPLAKKFWDQAEEKYLSGNELYTLDSRKVTFKFGSFKVPMFYTVEPVMWDDRFQIIEYTPTNSIVRLLQKL